MKEEEEREAEKKRREEEQERLEYERREHEMNERAQQEAEERRHRENRERMKRESEEREQRERERLEREERERKQREKREREERERRERERQEQERRAAEERKRFEDDVTIQAERKKKDEILQKLREIDEGGKKTETKEKPQKSSAFNDPFFLTQDKEVSQDSMSSSKKSYTFSKPTENLHQGKPSRKQDHSGMMFSTGKSEKSNNHGRRRDIDGLETGGYNPTFGSKKPAGSTSVTKNFSLFDDDEPKQSSTTQPNKTAQKSRLMEDLFGSKNETSGPKHDDLFASPKQSTKKTNQSRNTFPWEDDGPSKQSTLKTKRENSSTLFGGGNAFVNDEDIQKSQGGFNSTLPRRPKQTVTAFHSRPTVNAVDDLDDDIEEVML